jgi:hypothetical protein
MVVKRCCVWVVREYDLRIGYLAVVSLVRVVIVAEQEFA